MREGLIILFGESFRFGSEGTRTRGIPESYDAQITAAKSHMRFIEHLNKQNINISVILSSYTTQYDQDICNIYKDAITDSLFNENLLNNKCQVSSQSKLIHNAIDRDNIYAYDFILCMRIDIFLKDKFLHIFDPYSDKILFPSICWEKFCKIGNHPRVNDIMMFVPNKYFDIIKKINLSHKSWYDLVEVHKYNYEQIDTMLKTYHDSDSAKDFNPIYYIVNRPQTNIHHTKKLFNKDTFGGIHKFLK